MSIHQIELWLEDGTLVAGWTCWTCGIDKRVGLYGNAVAEADRHAAGPVVVSGVRRDVEA